MEVENTIIEPNTIITGKRKKYFIFLATVGVTPICFMFNAYLFVAVIFVAGIALSMNVQGRGNKLIVLILYTTLFSGVSVAGFRPYDLIILPAAVYLVIKKRSISGIPIRLAPFFVVIIFGLFNNMSTDSLMEAIRYLTCIILFLEIRTERYDLTDCCSEMIAITISNMFYAVSVFMMISSGHFSNYTSGLVTSNVFKYSLTELRLNAFFSDPNKYMAFCFALIFIAMAFVEKGHKRNILIVLTSIASVITLSRTALIVIAVFIGLRILVILRKKTKVGFYAALFVMMTIALIAIFFPEWIDSVVNELYVMASRLMGRERQLELSSTVQGDNRTRIWKMAIDLIGDKPLLGHGWMSNEWLLPYPTHNTFLAILLDGGILALTAYIIMFVPMIKSKRWDLTLSCVLVPSAMLDLQNYRMWFLILGLLVCRNIRINDKYE